MQTLKIRYDILVWSEKYPITLREIYNIDSYSSEVNVWSFLGNRGIAYQLHRLTHE